MDSYNLTEAYLEIYEANKGEKYLNLTAKQKKEERNRRNNPFKSEYGEVHRPESEVSRVRRYRHKATRGISTKKQRADIEREYQYSQRNSTPVDNTPRTPEPTPGRRSSLGSNAIKKTQPYLKFARTRLQRKAELAAQEKERMRADTERRMRPQAKNKIVPLNREEYEYLISHLINEGYASDFASAESICESMSDAWAYEILSESSLADMFSAEHERNAASIKRDEEALARLAALRASLAKHSGESETPKKTKPTGDVKSRIKKIKAKLERAQDIMDRQDRERH